MLLVTSMITFDNMPSTTFGTDNIQKMVTDSTRRCKATPTPLTPPRSDCDDYATWCSVTIKSGLGRIVSCTFGSMARMVSGLARNDTFAYSTASTACTNPGHDAKPQPSGPSVRDTHSPTHARKHAHFSLQASPPLL